jgi:hypothetical protein
MAANSTQNGMELLQLPDDDLLNILAYLDQESQLNSMLVCRRFECLIGQTYQLYKNRKLIINRSTKLPGKRCSEDPDMVQTRSKKLKPVEDNFWPFGTSFGEVTLWCFFFRPNDKNFAPLIDNLEVIGSKIIKLEIDYSGGYKKRFFDVLRLTNNVQELSISYLRIHQPRSKQIEQLNFPHLKSMELININDYEFVQDGFNKLNSLEHLKLQCWRDWNWEVYQPLVFRQTNLRSLELSYMGTNKFEWKELTSLGKLTLMSDFSTERSI